MVDIWGRNLKHQKVPPAHPDPNYGPGVLPLICPFGGGSHHMPLNFSSETNNDVKKLWWEAKCNQNTDPNSFWKGQTLENAMNFNDFSK